MKTAIRKSPIPESHAFVVKKLNDSFFDPTWHYHSEYQLFVVLMGSGTRFIGDSIKRFNEGEVTFTGPNLPHLWKSDEILSSKTIGYHSEGVVVYFNDEIIGERLLQKEEAIRIKQLLSKSVRGLDVLPPNQKEVEHMILKLLKIKGFAGVLQLLKILDFLSNPKNVREIASSGYVNSLKEGDTFRMNKVYKFVLNNFQKKISIPELAQITNMTPTSFSRYFKIHANKTFSEFISEIRIGHACKLLIEKKVNVSQACYESGFQTLSNFNRQFKRITKRTPLAYKKFYNMS